MFENVFHRHRETADAASGPLPRLRETTPEAREAIRRAMNEQPVKLNVESTTLAAKLDKLDEVMRLIADVVILIARRQQNMAQDTDALAALQAEWAALRDAATSALASAQNAAQVDAENAQLRAENDANANGLAQMRSEMEQMRAQLAALGHPAA